MKNLVINLWAKDATSAEISSAVNAASKLKTGEKLAVFAAGGWNLITMTANGPYLGGTRRFT